MPSIKEWLMLDKACNWMRAVKQAGGFPRAVAKLYRMDTVKFGALIGEDKYGNKYYQNDYYFFGKNRWVEFNEKCGLNYDGSMVPGEWHNWLQYMTDDPPTTKPRVNYKWMIDHTENFSGTNRQYVPYSTMPPKIAFWKPDGRQIKLKVK